MLPLDSGCCKSKQETTIPLELRTGRDGQLRPMWYGRYEVNGKRFTLNLEVKIAGTPPSSLSLRDVGDAAFERSRERARATLDHTIDEARRINGSAHLVERIYEIKTGERIQSVKLDDLAEEWTKIPRRRKPNGRYADQCCSTLARFVKFVQENNPKAAELGHVTRQTARDFMEAESARGVTAKTWNDTLKLLRAACKYLLPAGSINPFFGVPTRETETIFRKPFSPEELKAILDAAKGDSFIRPILIIGMCTAMRRGDCCLLKWTDVDLDRRFISVKTAKTGVAVAIPIFPMLYEELARRPQARQGYVFPEQAEMYQENPDGITWRVRKVLAAAGFKDVTNAVGVAAVDGDQDRDDAHENDRDGGQDGDDDGGKRGGASSVVPHRGNIRVERKEGLRRASVRDFHSLRVTWVTVALTAGVPLELVQKVTGHKTVDVVFKHYFQPGQEEFRNALQAAMPKLLTTGAQPPKEKMRQIIRKMTPKTLNKAKQQLLEILEKV